MIIHLTGGDTYRSAKRLAELRAAFITKHDQRRLNVVEVDGETANLATLKNAITASGMFSTKRFVSLDHYVPSGSLQVEILAEVVRNVVDKDSDVIFVIRDTLDAEGQVTKRAKKPTKKSGKKSSHGPFVLDGEKREEFSRLTPAQTAKWVTMQASSMGGSLEPAAVQRLIALCDNDTWRIATELEKLLAFAGHKPVMIEDVETMVTSESNSDIFALTDALGQRNVARALSLLHQELSAGTNEFSLIATLAGHLRTLYYVKQAQQGGRPASAMASELGLHPFVVQKATAQTTHFSSDQLRDWHHNLVTIDHDLKTSPLDAETLLDMLMMRS